ncbi:MAG: hypothetical protein Q9215_002644 [Flavoplaca cf. flavocitrina]
MGPMRKLKRSDRYGAGNGKTATAKQTLQQLERLQLDDPEIIRLRHLPLIGIVELDSELRGPIELPRCDMTAPSPGPDSCVYELYAVDSLHDLQEEHLTTPDITQSRGSETEPPLHRSHQNQLDVIYDHTARIWRCCGLTKGKSDCGHPINETFSAPAPANLSTFYPSSTSSLTTSASSALSTTTPVKSAEHTSPSPPKVTPADSSESQAEERNKTDAKETRGRLTTSDKVAIAVSIPATLATMVGAYFTYVAYRAREKRKKKPIVSASSSRPAGPRRP